MNRFLATSLAVAVGLGSQVFAQEAASDSTAKKPVVEQSAPATQVESEKPAAPEVKSNNEELTNLKGKVDGLEESYLETKGTVGKLAKIKFSGYAYAQLRYTPDFMDATDTTKTGIHGANQRTYGYPIGDFAGGAFPVRESSQFQLREARLKASYETDLSSLVFQIDVAPFTNTNVSGTTVTNGKTDSVTDAAGVKHYIYQTSIAATPILGGGGVTLKDAYYRFTDPWLKSIALQAGIFDRPYGFELHYSSSNRETPERSRLEQTLFPNERDLGFMIDYAPSDNMPAFARLFNIRGGLFTGNGINLETDDMRDFIGRFGLSIPVTDINLAIDAGLSGYIGTITDLSDSIYTTSNNAWTGTKGHLRDNVDRQYVGGDGEIYFGNTPVIGGTCLRLEATQGKQPCFGSGSSKSFASNLVSTSPVYERNILGYYVMLVQNIDPLKSQIALRYDSFDPNTDLGGADVKLLSDVQFNTIGGGWTYYWDENVKFMLYYENVMNEKCPNVTVGKTTVGTGAAAVTYPGYNYGDVLKNDILTFRIQYKF